jgi:uncharacterized membrane protein
MFYLSVLFQNFKSVWMHRARREVMMSPFIKHAVWVSTMLVALGAGLIGGVFFAFSSFVMRALAKLPVPEGIAAVQSINIAVINPLFMAVLLGTASGCALLAVYSLASLHLPGTWYLVSGSLL